MQAQVNLGVYDTELHTAMAYNFFVLDISLPPQAQMMQYLSVYDSVLAASAAYDHAA